MKARASTIRKSMRLIEAFEGYRVLAGNFDGQVLSWGVLQWNIGQGTLPPLLRRIITLDPAGAREALGDDLVDATMHSPQALERFARERILSANGGAKTKWQRAFDRLGLLDAAVAAQAEAAEVYHRRAESICEEFAFASERAYCLALDIAVQNGSVQASDRRLYQQHAERMARVSGRLESELAEWERMKALAHAVADDASPKWRRDVRDRKLTIALGQGWVHGRQYDLEGDFGIRYWAAGQRGIALEPWRDAGEHPTN